MFPGYLSLTAVALLYLFTQLLLLLLQFCSFPVWFGYVTLLIYFACMHNIHTYTSSINAHMLVIDFTDIYTLYFKYLVNLVKSLIWFNLIEQTNLLLKL